MGASVAQESGIMAFYALERRDAPGSFFIVEIYRDQQAYEAHLETEWFRSYKAEVAGIVQSLELIDLDVIAIAKSNTDSN